ncbi:hypothetical protein GCM10023237_11130 [Streptomyces coeruleoprunus]|uniref:fibronectin type III domain-containing protein n=1 Tax=Streptomyces coeruleoprunus TaxID=285563 RepID=UPI00337C15B7
MHRPRLLAVSAAPLAAVLLVACGAEERDTRPPSVPTGVTAQAGSATSAHVMWAAATDDRAVTGYDVFQHGRRVKTLPGDRTMVDVDRLAPSTTYRFTVRARDAAENSSPDSTPVDLTTAPGPGDGASTAPTGLTARARPARSS